ncbi:MAG: azurin, partial [Flavobacterium sp.]|nr:azurin [Flavobacterium sp.]
MKRLSNFALVAFAVFALNSCGSDKKTEDTHDQHAVPTESAETVTDETSTKSNNLSIDSNDQMQFTKNELRASVGTITLTLNHVGKMPKESMGHNLVILKPGTDIPAFAQKAVA